MDGAFGLAADLTEQWDEVMEFDHQLYTVLRSTMGGGLRHHWECVHGGWGGSVEAPQEVRPGNRRAQERSSYETLGAALERWKALRGRYNKKKDQFGPRKDLPGLLAMNALEKVGLEGDGDAPAAELLQAQEL